MNEPNTLNELLDLAVQKQGTDSGRELARRAQAEKFEIVHTTINGIRNGSYRSTPSDDTIRALSWLAGVGDHVAFTAAGRRLPGPPFAEELPPGVDELSPKEREAVIGLLRVLIAQRQEISDYDEEQEPRTEEGSPEYGSTGRSARRPGAPIAADPSAARKAAAELGKRAANVVRGGNGASEGDNPDDLIEGDQAAQLGYALAARKGETQQEWELRTQAKSEDESQDPPEHGG